MHSGGGLFTDASHLPREAEVQLRIRTDFLAQQIQDHTPFGGIVVGVERRDRARVFILHALVKQHGCVSAIVDDQLGAAAVRPLQRLARTPPVLLKGLALPGEHRNSLGILHSPLTPDCHRSRGVVLRRENVAAHPSNVGAHVEESLDENGGLHGHVQRAHDPRALQGLLVCVPLTQRHQTGHFMFGQLDLPPSKIGEVEVCHLEGNAIVH